MERRGTALERSVTERSRSRHKNVSITELDKRSERLAKSRSRFKDERTTVNVSNIEKKTTTRNTTGYFG